MIPDRASAIEAATQALARAGQAGLPLDQVGVGTALHLVLHGFAVIDGERVRATGQGAAFARRGVFA